jgi:hypothetical protein
VIRIRRGQHGVEDLQPSALSVSHAIAGRVKRFATSEVMISERPAEVEDGYGPLRLEAGWRPRRQQGSRLVCRGGRKILAGYGIFFLATSAL